MALTPVSPVLIISPSLTLISSILKAVTSDDVRIPWENVIPPTTIMAMHIMETRIVAILSAPYFPFGDVKYTS
jgi:hypothetical protein